MVPIAPTAKSKTADFRTIEQAERDIEIPLEFLTIAKEIAHWHHEKWYGSGYPDRLAGFEDFVAIAEHYREAG
jgi:response regulator RpfG family c-di-GMP phosphodiesterase